MQGSALPTRPKRNGRPFMTQSIDMRSAEEVAQSEALKATEQFVNTRALEILREWVNSPEIAAILDEAERVKAADAARKNAA